MQFFFFIFISKKAFSLFREGIHQISFQFFPKNFYDKNCPVNSFSKKKEKNQKKVLIICENKVILWSSNN